MEAEEGEVEEEVESEGESSSLRPSRPNQSRPRGTEKALGRSQGGGHGKGPHFLFPEAAFNGLAIPGPLLLLVSQKKAKRRKP